MRPLTDLQKETLEASVLQYESNLLSDPAAMGYLSDRGISLSTALTHRLGVADRSNPLHAKHDGWLAIPYLALDGHPVTVRFRCLEDHKCRDHGHGKYATIAGDPARMYGVQNIAGAKGAIHLTEGEMDSIILNANGYPAVAIPGANGWQYRHARMLAGFSRVYVWPDPDDAGARFASDVAASMPNSAVILRLDGGDVNETFLANGADGLREVLDKTPGVVYDD